MIARVHIQLVHGSPPMSVTVDQDVRKSVIRCLGYRLVSTVQAHNRSSLPEFLPCPTNH